VSAIWGGIGLALIVLGLRARRRVLRYGGLLILAVTLGKLFTYDLAELNLMARAVSFVCVGLVLLAGGAVYARLADAVRSADGDTAAAGDAAAAGGNHGVA
jgi:uncharacterized membrane protein